MEADGPLVYLVTPDLPVAGALHAALARSDVSVRTFATGGEFWRHFRPDGHGCAVVDLHLADVPGLALLERVRATCEVPVVLIAAEATIPAAVRAIKAGAFDFLEKPIDAVALIRAVEQALELDARLRDERARDGERRRRMAQLTPREVQVVQLVVAGRVNKQIARMLGISPKTVEFHRARAMRKLGAQHVSELVQAVLAAPPAPVRAPAR